MSSDASNQNDPVARATTVAAKLNQLSLENVDASAIAVSWNGDKGSYVIKVNGEKLVEVNRKTILPDTTRNPAVDALQATNRLRRLMGNAPPLREIAGYPNGPRGLLTTLELIEPPHQQTDGSPPDQSWARVAVWHPGMVMDSTACGAPVVKDSIRMR
jgi:hypothetical protein